MHTRGCGRCQTVPAVHAVCGEPLDAGKNTRVAVFGSGQVERIVHHSAAERTFAPSRGADDSDKSEHACYRVLRVFLRRKGVRNPV